MRLLREAVLRGMTVWQGVYARLTDEKGQTLAEYGLLITVISVIGIVAAVIVFREAINATFLNAVGCLDGEC